MKRCKNVKSKKWIIFKLQLRCNMPNQISIKKNPFRNFELKFSLLHLLKYNNIFHLFVFTFLYFNTFHLLGSLFLLKIYLLKVKTVKYNEISQKRFQSVPSCIYNIQRENLVFKNSRNNTRNYESNT